MFVSFHLLYRSSQFFVSLLLLFYLFQETDASLLMITGFPAFAVSDASLCKKAKDIVLEKLEVRS